MSLLAANDWRAAEAISEIGFTNPFLAERTDLEKQALGRAFRRAQPVLQYRADTTLAALFPNVVALRDRTEKLLASMRSKLVAGERGAPRELEVYENLVFFCLYARYMSAIVDLPAGRFRTRPGDDVLASYDAFAKDFAYYLELPGMLFPSKLDRDTIFAGLFQVERAFFHIFRHIVGSSSAAANLRAAIWQSIFTWDMRRYMRGLHRTMGDMPTLITGPSGTGKELVAQCIAFSRFVEFDARQRRFLCNYADHFVALNLTAMAPTLIESELFGHAKGAFTDAKTERTGYLDESNCPRWGTVFLDEVGELEETMQVKLLRVLQSREFQRVGGGATRKFVGKIVAATNRDLAAEMQAGRFREDFYYRLCADRIETPSLAEQLRESPDDLTNFIRFIAPQLLLDSPEEAECLTEQVATWVAESLGPDYAWPGNIRELEQCVRSILIRGYYVPVRRRPAQDCSALIRFLGDIEAGSLNRDQLFRGYASLVYAQTGSYQAAGRQLGVDWRTAKDAIDQELASRFASDHSQPAEL